MLSYKSYKEMASEETNACPGSDGDLIVFPRPLYDHYAVCGENGYIFHVTSASGLNTSDSPWNYSNAFYSTTNPSMAVIKKEKCNAFIQEWDKAYVEKHCSLPISEIVDRANSSVGEEGYNLLTNNCEHFARWCCDGEWKSKQADTLMPRLSIMAGSLLTLFISSTLFARVFRREDRREERT